MDRVIYRDYIVNRRFFTYCSLACGLWTLSRDFAHTINETLKWLARLPTLMHNHSGGDSVASRC